MDVIINIYILKLFQGVSQREEHPAVSENTGGSGGRCSRCGLSLHLTLQVSLPGVQLRPPPATLLRDFILSFRVRYSRPPPSPPLAASSWLCRQNGFNNFPAQLQNLVQILKEKLSSNQCRQVGTGAALRTSWQEEEEMRTNCPSSIKRPRSLPLHVLLSAGRLKNRAVNQTARPAPRGLKPLRRRINYSHLPKSPL